jgi:anti-anti-sigma factor
MLNVNGPLHAPQGAGLRHDVQARLHRGERRFVLSLAKVSRVDAAGIGELVRAYNLSVSRGGALRITQVNPEVREILDRVGLLEILAGDRERSDR